jgi:NAD(P)-dependent dehydrogenase (short-subunit alcohol dehydrogenase family)
MNSNLFDLKGKIIVVTGGMGQLGGQFVSALVEHGAKVAVLDVIADDDAVVEKFGDLLNTGSVMTSYCDITSRASIIEALNEVTESWGTPDGLVNNAALDSPPDAHVNENGPFEEFPESSWDKIMEVNSKGVFLLCQVIGGAMADQFRGSIINISSIYGIVSPNQKIYEYRRQNGGQFYKPVAYSASKSSLMNLTRYLATYWGTKGVRVNTLVMGGVYNSQPKEFLDGYCAHVPMERMAEESEYNGAVIFLLSHASSYMTGSTLTIDGGWTAW